MQRALLTALLLAAAAAAGFWLGAAHFGNAAEPPETSGWVYDRPRDPGPFELVDHRGDAFTPDAVRDGWHLWFFGFTHCPDICPMTLTTLDLVDRALHDGGHPRPGVLMVSVDPARDTPEQLRRYVPHFNPDFTGVTGTAGEIRRLTERLGVAVAYRANGGDGDYTVDHSSVLLLTGPDGLVRAAFQPPHDPDTLARDIAVLIPWLERNT